MKKRFIIPAILLILVLTSIAIVIYSEFALEKAVAKAEMILARKLSMEVKITGVDASFFSKEVYADLVEMRKSGESVISAGNCSVGNLIGLVSGSDRTLNIHCKSTKIDITKLKDGISKKEKTDTSNKTKSSKRMSFPVNFSVGDLMLTYGKIKEEMSFNMSFDAGEGVARIKRESNGKSGSIEILFSLLKNEATVRFENIDLGGFGKLASNLSDIALLEGTISGLCTVKKNGDLLKADIDTSITKFGILHHLVDEKKFQMPFVRYVGKIDADIKKKEVTFEQSRISLGGISGTLSGRYSPKTKLIFIDLKKIELNRLETLVRDSRFKEYLFGGNIDLEIRYFKDEELGESFSLVGDVIDPVQLSQRLNYLNLPFEYSFKENTQESRTFIVGPKNIDYTDSQSFPEHLKWAVIVSEDAGFYVHKGVDFREIDAAVKDNMKKKKFRGGSTITQQLAKNLFLERKKTLLRKFREAILAVELDATLSKRRQLEIYLNIIEWGPNVFGISEAAYYYFGKTPMELTPLESAYLASIIPGPHKYNFQFRKKEISEKWKKRLINILGLMNETGHLDLGDYYDAQTQDLIFREN